MKFHQLALFLVLANVANSVVSAKDAGIKEQVIAFRPTEAPLRMSTARPTVAPKVNKQLPTRAMSYNVPPKVKTITALGENEKLSEVAPMPAPAVEETDPMVAMESKDALPVMLRSQEIHSHKMQVGDVKPIQVTGFITRNGNIYEIEGKDGIGLIEARQSPAEEKQVNVCNYGSVVIYSDVPCDQVTNVKVGEIEQHIDTPQVNAPVPSESSSSNNSTQLKPQDDEDLEDFNENSARKRKQQNKNRRRNGNGNRRRPIQNGNRKPQGNRVKKPAKTQQQLRQQQKKRQQLQRQQQKRRQQQWQRQQNKNRLQQQNRRKVAQRQQEDEFYSGEDGQDDYESEESNQQQPNRRKVAQSQQEDDYYSGDDGQDDYDSHESNQKQPIRRKVVQRQQEDDYYSLDGAEDEYED